MVQERPVRVERRLSAILAADVAGYSRLMQDAQRCRNLRPEEAISHRRPLAASQWSIRRACNSSYSRLPLSTDKLSVLSLSVRQLTPFATKPYEEQLDPRCRLRGASTAVRSGPHPFVHRPGLSGGFLALRYRSSTIQNPFPSQLFIRCQARLSAVLGSARKSPLDANQCFIELVANMPRTPSHHRPS